MSVTSPPPTTSLSKEEKKARKEAKKAAKALKSTESTIAPVPTQGTSTSEEVTVEKKEKKEKSKKRSLEGDDVVASATATATEGSEEKPKKKKKKSKDSAAISSETTTPAEGAATETTETTAPLSKKQQKKLKALSAPTTSSSAPAATTTAIPTVDLKTPFLPAHTTYLTTNGITLTPSLYPPLFSIPSLPINPSLQPYLSTYTTPTPIQACSWPPLLAHRDVVGIAETGSGKTLSFGVPAIHHLSLLPAATSSKKGKSNGNGKGNNQIQCLVLAPTRELAQQSFDTLLALGGSVGIGAVCLYGGVGKDEQVRELSKTGTRVVVGTPGRTLDLANQGEMDLSGVSYLVLDEADRMLDQGFENDIRRIIAFCPDHTKGRQTVMFSATWPESVRRLASTFLHDPIKITVGSDELSVNKRIEHVVEVFESSRDKDPRLLHHLKAHLKISPSTPTSPTRILVFALYKKEAQRLEGTIRRAGYNVGALHGDMSQDARFKALDNFKTGKVNVLVATDVAARGLDIPDVGLVLNVTFPLTTEDFVHRCGRTGRAGKSGKAVTFFTGENHERSLAGEFMRVLRDVGAEIPAGMDRFPSTIKKKEHGSYGAFFKDTADAPAPTKITFD